MKNFSIKSLTLMAMVVMVYAATVKLSHKTQNDHQRKLIRDQANKMLKEGHWNNTNDFVPKISDEQTCVENFFCLAEESLKADKMKDKSKTCLIRLLHKYNEVNKTHCNLTTSTTYRTVKLLADISRCATK